MPTFVLGKTASLVVNSQDYSDSAYKEDLESSIEALDVTTHGSSYHKTQQAGLVETSFSYSLYYSRTVALALRTLATGRTTHTVVYGPEGSSTGMERITISGFIASLKKGVAPDGVPTLDVEMAYGTTVPVYDTY
jgi:methylaspartate ammonia-lyase